MTTLHEEKSCLAANTTLRRSMNSKQNLANIRWNDGRKGNLQSDINLVEKKGSVSPEFNSLDKKGNIHPENCSLVSSGYESKAVSISTLSDEEQELSPNLA